MCLASSDPYHSIDDSTRNRPDFALPSPFGGLARDSIHALALGNVYTFSILLSKSPDAVLQNIAIIGAGGVRSPAAVSRMRQVGARIVACTMFLEQEGVRALKYYLRALSDQTHAYELK